MGGASDEFPLLAAYGLYAADINGDGILPYAPQRSAFLVEAWLTRLICQVIACSMLCRTKYMVTRTITTR